MRGNEPDQMQNCLFLFSCSIYNLIQGHKHTEMASLLRRNGKERVVHYRHTVIKE